jgi:flagellar assembly protein FliH
LFKQILKPKDAEGQVLAYQPRAISHEIPRQAIPFARTQDEQQGGTKDFMLNPLVAQNTGLTELERKNFQTRVEEETLKRLKVVEERAYAEAHALGMKDGRDQAFERTSAEIAEALASLNVVAQGLATIKIDLLVANESHLMKMVFHIAKALALKDITASPDSILPVLTKALENATGDEEIVVRLNPKDADFIEGVKGAEKNPFERVARVRVEVSDALKPGGCMIETNYGVIDATIEQRVEKLWTDLAAKLPHVVKD